MLVEDRIAPFGGVEKPHTEDPAKYDENKRNRKDGGGKHLHPARSIKRPYEKRHLEPSHPWRTQPVDGRNEIKTGKYGGKPEDKDTEDRKRDIGLGPDTVRRIKSPAGIGRPALCSERKRDDNRSGKIEPPREPVKTGERNIFCPYHDRQEEIAEGHRHTGNNEKEDHDYTVYGEDLIVSVLAEDLSGGDQAHPDKKPKHHTYRKKSQYRNKILDPYAFMVGGHKP